MTFIFWLKYAKDNKDYAKQAGVKHISLPKKGKLKPEEKEFQSTPKFKQLQCWRAGGEAKISWLKRTCNLAAIAKATAG